MEGRGDAMTAEERFELLEEIGYIQKRAALRESRVVSVGDLLLFSARNGDAWMLDTRDRLALRLADKGEAVSIAIDAAPEAESFAVSWPGRYRIDGMAFIYVDERGGGIESFSGYPTQQIAGRSKTQAAPLLAADRETLNLLRRMRNQ